MYSITVTIGRNAPVTDPTLPQYHDVTGERVTAPMSDQRWHAFEQDVQELLSRATGAATETHHGVGSWGGVTEESTKVTLLADNPLNVNLGYIRVNLSDLARKYEQDAIALTIGESELITA